MPGQADQVGQVYDQQHDAQQCTISQRKRNRKDKEHHHEHPDHARVRDVFLYQGLIDVLLVFFRLGEMSVQTFRAVEPEKTGQQIENSCRQERQEHPDGPEGERQ